MESTSIIQQALQNLSSTLSSQAEARRLKDSEDEKREQSVYEHLLTHKDRKVKEMGLAALLEKPKTKRSGFLGLKKDRVSPARDVVKNYFDNLEQQEKAAQIVATPVEAPTPPPEMDMTSATMTGRGGESAPAPVSDAPPDFSTMAAKLDAKRQGRRDEFDKRNPYEGGESYKADPVLEAVDYAEAFNLPREQAMEIVEGKVDPLGTRLSAQREMKEYDWQKRVAQDAAKHGFKMDENAARNLVSLSASQAERFGLQPGDRIDSRVMSDMTRADVAGDSNAVRLQVADLMRQGQIIPIRTIDESGRPITMLVTKQGAGGQSFAAQPSAAEEKTLTGRKLMLQDVDLVSGLIEGNEDLVGPARGMLEKGKRVFSSADPTWVKLDDTLNRMRTGQLYELTGKAAAEWERAGIGRMVPQLDTLQASPQLFKQQLAGYKRAADQFLDTYRGGAYAPDKTSNEIDPPPNKPKPAGTSGKKVGDTKVFTAGPYKGKTGTWNGTAWDVPE